MKEMMLELKPSKRINELKAIKITLFNDLKEDYNKSLMTVLVITW